MLIKIDCHIFRKNTTEDGTSLKLQMKIKNFFRSVLTE